jgi:hypothetical protein
MPQFDIITFFTQIFWLTIIFFGFYFVTLQSFIPKIAAVIKARKKKLAHGAGGVSSLNEEQVSIETIRNNSLEFCADSSKAGVTFMVTSANNWLLTSILGFNNTKMNASQSSYVKTFGSFFSTSYISIPKDTK